MEVTYRALKTPVRQKPNKRVLASSPSRSYSGKPLSSM